MTKTESKEMARASSTLDTFQHHSTGINKHTEGKEQEDLSGGRQENEKEETSIMLERIMRGLRVASVEKIMETKMARSDNNNNNNTRQKSVGGDNVIGGDDRESLHGLKEHMHEVWNENAAIQRKRYVYKKTYYEFLLGLGEHIAAEEEEVDDHPEILHRQDELTTFSRMKTPPPTPTRTPTNRTPTNNRHHSRTPSMSPMPRHVTLRSSMTKFLYDVFVERVIRTLKMMSTSSSFFDRWTVLLCALLRDNVELCRGTCRLLLVKQMYPSLLYFFPDQKFPSFRIVFI